jgi:hypothetical protein
LKRSATQSARTLDLYQQVTDLVARQALAPSAMQPTLNAFLQTRGTAYGDRLTQLNMRFFGEMVRISTAYLRGLGHAVRPEMPLPPPPVFDRSDPARWYRQVTDYSRELGTNATESYQSLLNEVAAGRASPRDVQQATSAYLQQRMPEFLRELGELYFELLTNLNDLRADSEQEFLSSVLDRAGNDQGDGAFALTLSAPVGGMAQASMSIANTRDERARIHCRATDVRRADGVGPAFVPRITITPEALELTPGEEGRLVLTLQLDPEHYDTGALYVGTVYITGHGEPRLQVPLRIIATEPAAGTAGP